MEASFSAEEFHKNQYFGKILDYLSELVGFPRKGKLPVH
jgi:hypothetical protein